MDDGETTNDSKDGLIDHDDQWKRKKPKPPNKRRIRRIKRTADQIETTADE